MSMNLTCTLYLPGELPIEVYIPQTTTEVTNAVLYKLVGKGDSYTNRTWQESCEKYTVYLKSSKAGKFERKEFGHAWRMANEKKGYMKFGKR